MRIPLQDLILRNQGITELGRYFNKDFAGYADSDYADERGFHVYGRMRPKLKLYAPDNGGDANRMYRAIQAFTKISAECAASYGGQLLEAQGVMTHFLFPEEENTARTQERIIEFANVLFAGVEQTVKPICGNFWNGFAVSADHGRAILVSGSADSVVSLGPCANRPAKRIYRRDDRLGVPAGELHIRNMDGTWRKEVLSPASVNIQLRNKQSNFVGLAEEIVREATSQTPMVRHLGYEDIPAFMAGKRDTPVTVQAHMARADMHNFTKRVSEAFEAGNNTAIQQLATEFTQTMTEGEQTIASYDAPTHQLPWAGDCANFVIMPTSDGYDSDRAAISAKLGAHWHDAMSKNKGRSNEVSWTLGCAGGGAENEANGLLLIGLVQADNRSFKIVAGWGATHSQRAQEMDDAQEYDTAVPDCDYQALTSVLQPLYRQCGSTFNQHRFYRAEGLTEKKVKGAYIGGLAKQTVSVKEPVSAPYVRHYAR
ncbi:MAG: hypothetical protein Q7Q73_03930 [Verrucomicrobiota bacterium JB024]|nr:hypothetical protein [Verrucomicrobiota bacterium JB024]